MHLEEIAVDLQGSVLTSLSMQQVLELASYARGLGSQDFIQMVLGLPDYGYGAVINSPEGPIWEQQPSRSKFMSWACAIPPVAEQYEIAACTQRSGEFMRSLRCSQTTPFYPQRGIAFSCIFGYSH